MLSNSECATMAARKVKEIFGRDYLINNRENLCTSLGEGQNNKYMAFFGIKTSSECPHMKANDIGWTVFADIIVNKVTGEVIVRDYQTEEES